MSRGIALRDRDKESLRVLAGWHEGARAERRFVCDPMPSRISSAFAGLIFGREPTFEAANAADQTRLDDLVRENNFKSALGGAARTASSEGEVWWRCYVDRDVADFPLLDWHSRTSVYPLWLGWRLMAVAFISRLSDRDEGGLKAYRHFEVHEIDGENGGRVENVLYEEPVSRSESAAQSRRSSEARRLGERVTIDTHPETEGLMEEWRHGLPTMLGGRVANMIGADPTIGISDYHDVEDFLIELNIAASIASANMDLTARKRVVVPEEQVSGATGVVDVGEQVLVEGGGAAASLGEGSKGTPPYRVLEYSFDAEALIAYKREIERTALNRIGIDAQYAGIDPAEGRAESGTALRIRLIPSEAAGEERGQEWDQTLPKAVRALQLLDAAPDGGSISDNDEAESEEGLGERDQLRGFGRSWANAEEEPVVDRGSTLPEDRTEATERRAEAVTARIMSRRTAIEEDHPDWSEAEVQAELDRIEEDQPSTSTFGATIPPIPGRQGAETDSEGEEPAPESNADDPGPAGRGDGLR